MPPPLRSAAWSTLLRLSPQQALHRLREVLALGGRQLVPRLAERPLGQLTPVHEAIHRLGELLRGGPLRGDDLLDLGVARLHDIEGTGCGGEQHGGKQGSEHIDVTPGC